MAQRLIAYVKHGGHLVLGPRSGMKDEYNALIPPPARTADRLLGGRVEQFYALDKQVPVSGELGDGFASIWAEPLSPSRRTPKC